MGWSPSCLPRATTVSDTPCPFCGLVCDDLSVTVDASGAHPAAPACARASKLFEVPAQGQARVAGRPAELAAALHTAAAILAGAKRPLIGGLACDVTGQRAALALAERVGGILDHMNGVSQFRNWLAFQDGGWITTTLSEVRNRADLIILVGTAVSRYPRFFERCVVPDSQFGPLQRRVIVLGDAPASMTDSLGWSVTTIPVKANRLAELFGALRARLNGHTLSAAAIAGVAVEQVDAFLAQLLAARYGVMVWDAAELDFPHADLTVQALANLVKNLNRTTRWSGLPLGGSDGATSAAAVCTWQTGYPLRVVFESAGPRYEPLLFDTERLLKKREVDALLWISAIDRARTPPPAHCPSIVLGRADMTFEVPPDVFIPVAVPGVQHSGFLHRMDGVVALPLLAPAPARLLSVVQVLGAIQEEMNHAAA